MSVTAVLTYPLHDTFSRKKTSAKPTKQPQQYDILSRHIPNKTNVLHS